MNPIEHHPEYDELEKHLHANLRDYAPEAPDRLWAGIEARLPKQRRRPVLWWWLGMMVLLSSVVDPIHGPNTLSTAVYSVLPLNQVGYPISVSLPDGTMDKGFIITGPVDAQAGMPAKTSPSTPRTGAKKLAAALAILPVEASRTGNCLAESAKPHPLETLPEKEIAWLKNANPRLPAIHVPIKPPHAQHWEIGIVTAPVWIWQPAIGVEMHHGGPLSFTEHQQGPAFGWQKGLTIGYRLGAHWQVITGLSQRQTTQVSSHTATLRLMDGTCLNTYDPGPKEYEFQYALQSSGGQSNVTVRIAQVDSMSTMSADEPFMLDMRTTRRSMDWVLPLAIQRNFGRGRWQGFVQGGGQLNLSARTAIQVDHFTEGCIDLCFASGRMPMLTLAERGQTSMSWQLGAGIGYALTPQWGLSITPTFFEKRGQSGLSLNAGLHFKL